MFFKATFFRYFFKKITLFIISENVCEKSKVVEVRKTKKRTCQGGRT